MTSAAFEFKVNPDLNWINPVTGPAVPKPVQWAKVFGRH
jgi:hypothetical protein